MNNNIVTQIQFHFLIKKGGSYIVQSRSEVGCINRIFQPYKKEEQDQQTCKKQPLKAVMATRDAKLPWSQTTSLSSPQRLPPYTQAQQTYTLKTETETLNERLLRNTETSKVRRHEHSPQDMEMKRAKALLAQYRRRQRKYRWGLRAMRSIINGAWRSTAQGIGNGERHKRDGEVDSTTR